MGGLIGLCAARCESFGPNMKQVGQELQETNQCGIGHVQVFKDEDGVLPPHRRDEELGQLTEEDLPLVRCGLG